MAFLIFGHVDANPSPLHHHKETPARAFASSVFPTPVGPRNRKLPIGLFGSFESGSGAPDAVCYDLDGFLLIRFTRWCRCSSRRSNFCTSPSRSFVTGTPVHLETISAMSSSSTSSLRSLPPRLVLSGASAAFNFCSNSRNFRISILQLSQIGCALGLFDREFGRFNVSFQRLNFTDCFLLGHPLSLEPISFFLNVGNFSLNFFKAFFGRIVLFFFSASRSISNECGVFSIRPTRSASNRFQFAFLRQLRRSNQSLCRAKDRSVIAVRKDGGAHQR